MPLKNYGVLVGRAVDRRAEGGTDTPHFQIHVRASGVDYRIAVNVLSKQSPSELLYFADERFRHPLLDQLGSLAEGFSEIASGPSGLALDFIRGNLLDRTAMRPMPATAPGPDNDLADKLAHFADRAIADAEARVYAFGERWGPEPGRRDKVFGFDPGNGVHDIHMNQGNSGAFVSSDGVWQDGGLLLHFPAADQWVAIFLAFQSQAWHTDDRTGHTLGGDGEMGPAPQPAIGEPDHRLRIVAALVNPVGPAPERETVTLLNPGSEAVVLTGWSLVDRMARTMPLPAIQIPPGDAVRIPLQAPVQLGNSGGLLTLLDAEGLKVDGIAYTKDQVRVEGRSLVF